MAPQREEWSRIAQSRAERCPCVARGPQRRIDAVRLAHATRLRWLHSPDSTSLSAVMSAAAPSAAASSSSASAPVDPARLPSALAARGINHSDKARWKTIYPIYINSAKKVSEGRKLPVKDCIEKPSVYDIADMCVFLKLPYIIEVRHKKRSSGSRAMDSRR